MSKSTKQDIIAMGRTLCHHQLWEILRKFKPQLAKNGESALEKEGISPSDVQRNFDKSLDEYLGAVADKTSEAKDIIAQIVLPFEDIVKADFADIVKPQSLEELAEEIAKRGNDMQTTHSKDGLKVFEVSKKLITVIRS